MTPADEAKDSIGETADPEDEMKQSDNQPDFGRQDGKNPHESDRAALEKETRREREGSTSGESEP
ncbi:MAG: hypothetical protein WA110_08805, partial [Anaerolineaceae bacterium]